MYGAGFFLEYAGPLGPLEYIYAVAATVSSSIGWSLATYMYGLIWGKLGLLGRLGHACRERFAITDS